MSEMQSCDEHNRRGCNHGGNYVGEKEELVDRLPELFQKEFPNLSKFLNENLLNNKGDNHKKK
jgi:hypothetical protein